MRPERGPCGRRSTEPRGGESFSTQPGPGLDPSLRALADDTSPPAQAAKSSASAARNARGNSARSVGARGEAIAAEHLRSLGFAIVATNVRTRYGEIDIIARDGDTLVFVEVKARRGIRYGSPQEGLSARKQARLRVLAEAYLQELAAEPPVCRIDVVAIAFGRGGSVESIDLIRDAV